MSQEIHSATLNVLAKVPGKLRVKPLTDRSIYMSVWIGGALLSATGSDFEGAVFSLWREYRSALHAARHAESILAAAIQLEER